MQVKEIKTLEVKMNADECGTIEDTVDLLRKLSNKISDEDFKLWVDTGNLYTLKKNKIDMESTLNTLIFLINNIKEE